MYWVLPKSLTNVTLPTLIAPAPATQVLVLGEPLEVSHLSGCLRSFWSFADRRTTFRRRFLCDFKINHLVEYAWAMSKGISSGEGRRAQTRDGLVL